MFVVITDCWPKAVEPTDVIDNQITAAKLEHWAPDALFIPWPPVARGQEVSADAMASPSCCVFEAKSFLLHARNALLEAVARAIR